MSEYTSFQVPKRSKIENVNCGNERWCIPRSKYIGTYRTYREEESAEVAYLATISPQKFSLAATQGQSTRNNAVAIRVGDRTVSLVDAGVRWQVWTPRDEFLLFRSRSQMR